MSCERCERRQDLRGPQYQKQVVIRVGNGNVELVGCDEHITILINLIRKGGDPLEQPTG